MYGYIYETICLINGKKYIGQHKYEGDNIDPNYIGYGKLLSKAIRKYGRDNFSCSILEWCNSSEDLSTKEKYYIALNDAVNSSNYYNIDDGRGNSHTYICESETKMKLSEQQIDRKAIHKNGIVTYVKQEDLQTYLNDGWLLGLLPKDRSEQYKKIADHRSSNIKWRQAISITIKGRKWITNGVEDKQIDASKLDDYLQNNWKLGRTFGGRKINRLPSSTTIENIC